VSGRRFIPKKNLQSASSIQQTQKNRRKKKEKNPDCIRLFPTEEGEAKMKRGRSAPRDESSDEDIGPSLPPSAKPIAPAPSLIAVPLLRGVTEAQLQVAQEALPNSLYYERSYMHRDIVTHVVVTPATDFLLTASADGCIKFWRKGAEGIVFVKAYRAHLGEICAVAASHDGVRLATCGDDGTLKLFDVATFDMVTFSKLNFLPSCASWCYPPGSPTHTLALGDRHSPIIRLFDGDTGILFAQHSSLTLHTAPVCAMSYAPSIDTCLSGDAKGILECWSGDRDRGFTPPAGILNYDSKLDTDLYDLVKIKATPDAISWHPRGIFFLVASSDRVLRLFSTGSGKCLAKYGYSAEACTLEGLALFGEEEWRRRVAVEADVESAAIWSRQKLLAAPLPEGPVAPSPNDSSPPSSNSSYSAAINPQSSPTPLFTSRTPRTVGWFDYSGHFVLFTTPLGVKVVCIDTQKTCAILGARERERFVGGAMFQGISSGIGAAAAGGTGGDSSATSSGGVVTGGNSLSPDPMVFLCAYGRPRFYCLSSRDPPGAPKVLPGQLKGVITTRKGEESGQEDRQEEEEEEEDGRGPHHSRDSMNEPPNRLDSASAALVKRAAAATAGKHSGESMTSLQGGGGGRLPGGRPNLGGPVASGRAFVFASRFELRTRRVAVCAVFLSCGGHGAFFVTLCQIGSG